MGCHTEHLIWCTELVAQRPYEGEASQPMRGEMQTQRAHWEVPAGQLVPGLVTMAGSKEQGLNSLKALKGAPCPALAQVPQGMWWPPES